jgi:putative DNA primase/helicase
MQLLQHSPEHLFTRRGVANYDINSEANLFIKTLRESLPDAKDRHLLQLLCGNIFVPDSRFEIATIAIGEACSGKSTIAEAIAGAIGDAVQRLTLNQICDPRGYFLPNLEHAAMNLATELDAIALDDSAAFKTIVSGEQISVREIYGRPFKLLPTTKLFFLANHLPRFKNGTSAELRRISFLVFDQKPVNPDPLLKKKLTNERDGIFLFMLEGLKLLLASGKIPPGGEKSAAIYRRFEVSNDPLLSFVNSRCTRGSHLFEPKDRLCTAFVEFCTEFGFPVQFADAFLRRLYDRFPEVKASKRSVAGLRRPCLDGIALKDG